MASNMALGKKIAQSSSSKFLSSRNLMRFLIGKNSSNQLSRFNIFPLIACKNHTSFDFVSLVSEQSLYLIFKICKWTKVKMSGKGRGQRPDSSMNVINFQKGTHYQKISTKDHWIDQMYTTFWPLTATLSTPLDFRFQ